MQQEKYAYDAMCDAACEYRCEVALKSLQEEYGNKLEFTDKEIEAALRSWTRQPLLPRRLITTTISPLICRSLHLTLPPIAPIHVRT